MTGWEPGRVAHSLAGQLHPRAGPDEHALVRRLAEHAIAVRPGTALGIPGTALRPTTLANRKITHHVSASRRTTSAPTPDVTRFGYLRIRSLVLPVTSMLFSMILVRQ